MGRPTRFNVSKNDTAVLLRRFAEIFLDMKSQNRIAMIITAMMMRITAIIPSIFSLTIQTLYLLIVNIDLKAIFKPSERVFSRQVYGNPSGAFLCSCGNKESASPSF